MKLDLLKSASLAALCLLTGAAHAQTANTTADADEAQAADDVIVVTGIRQLNRSSINAKRFATGITDSITYDSVGLLPDLTAVQVAQRIPGVSTVGATGVTNDRSGDNSESIVIRGIDSSFNLITLDGVPLAVASEAISSGSNRAATIDIIAPSAIEQFQVIKTLSADNIPQALSGQLNLVSRSAFTSGRSFLARLALGQNSTAGNFTQDDDLNKRAEFTFTNTFGTQDQFGLVVGFSYQDFMSTNFEEKPGARDDTYYFYDTNGDRTDILSESTGFAAAKRAQFFIFENARERLSSTVKFEYQPTNQTYVSVYGGYFSEDEQETRYEQLFSGEDDNFAPEGQTANTGTWSGNTYHQIGAVHQPQDRETFLITGVLEHDFNDESALSARLSYSDASSTLPRVMSSFNLRSPDAGYTYDVSTGRPVLSINNPEAVEIGNLGENYIRDRLFKSEQDVLFFDTNYTHNFQDGDNGLGYKLGLGYTKRGQSFDQDYEEGDVGGDISANGFLKGVAKGYDAQNVDFYIIDPLAHLAAWNAAGRPITNDRSDNGIQDDFSLDEEILAPYALASFTQDRFMISAGVRYESVDVNVDNFARDGNLDDDPNDAAQFVASSSSYSYEEWLPSVIGTFDATDNIKLRAAYGRTLGRPDFDDYAARESFSEPDVATDPLNIRRGNPDLKPRISDNYDISAEYYFDEGNSFVSVAAFYKDIEGFITVENTTLNNFEFDGVVYDQANVSQPVNLNDASLSGVEFSFTKDFANTLPAPFDGLLLSGNLVLIDGEFEVPSEETASGLRTTNGFLNQPDLLANLILGYDSERFGFNIGYNYVGDYNVTLSDEYAYYDVQADARGQLDVQFRYSVNEAFTLTAEVQNLTEENRVSSRPDVNGWLAQDTEVGRIVWFGASWKPGFLN